MHTLHRTRHASRIRSTASAALAILALAFGTQAAFGKDSDPITIEGTVEVQGVVETVNDVLNEPYVRTANASGDHPIALFDVPEGKRLIIEGISFQASRPTNETNRMFLELEAVHVNLSIALPVQSTSDEDGTTYMISFIPMKVRVDAIAGEDAEVAIRRGAGSQGGVFAAVYGYLVDL